MRHCLTLSMASRGVHAIAQACWSTPSGTGTASASTRRSRPRVSERAPTWRGCTRQPPLAGQRTPKAGTAQRCCADARRWPRARMRVCRAGLGHHVWDVELYGELLEIGGGKERMTKYFLDRFREEPFLSTLVRPTTGWGIAGASRRSRRPTACTLIGHTCKAGPPGAQEAGSGAAPAQDGPLHGAGGDGRHAAAPRRQAARQ